MFRGVLASRAGTGRGGVSAQGSEPDGRGVGLGSGYLESIESQGHGFVRAPPEGWPGPKAALLGALRME